MDRPNLTSSHSLWHLTETQRTQTEIDMYNVFLTDIIVTARLQ